jgi:DNA-binding CsgD family transcriptional regulator
MAAAPEEVVGREGELATVSACIAAPEATPAFALLLGDPGVGKTTIWRAALAADAEHAHTLVARPASAEARLSYAALADLVGSSFDAVVRRLAAPRRRALEIAIRLREPEGESPDPLAVGLALSDALRALARDGGVLLAIDDLQWADADSAEALAFALRRLAGEPVAVVATARRRDEEGWRRLASAVDDPQLVRVSVEPLAPGPLHEVVRKRLGVALPRPLLLRIHAISGGNPFFALQLARLLRAGEGGTAAARELRLPDTLETLVRERLAGLSAETRRALLLAAAAIRPTGTLLASAGVAEEHLWPAVEADVLELQGDEVRFAHPLLASGVYSSATVRARREAHRLLASVTGDLEERARHAGAATLQADEEVAGLLEAAAEAALARGAPEAAAELAERAVELTPPGGGEEAARRTLAAARAYVNAGDPARARELLAGSLAELEAGPLRARMRMVLSDSLEAGGDEELFESALRDAGEDHAVRAEVLRNRAVAEWAAGRPAAAADTFRLAVEAGERGDDPAILAASLAGLVFAEFFLGRAVEDTLERGLEVEEALERPPLTWGSRGARSVVLLFTGRLDEARALLVAELARAESEGDEVARLDGLQLLSHLEWYAGNFERSRELAAEGLAVFPGIGEHVLLYRKARAEAALGRLDEARSAAAHAIELATQAGDQVHATQAHAAAGFVEVTAGEAERALVHVGDLRERVQALQAGEPAMFPSLADQVEAFVAVGRLDDAEDVSAWLEERGRALDRAWALAVAARGRGLVAAARGDVDPALAAFELAHREHARVALPFERARTLLAHGRVLRRAKRRREAREALGSALAAFEELRADPWAEKARAELARIGGRSAERGLTPSEERIARLVAAGASNKQVAAELYLTVNTVESTLKKVYGKVGVRSRTELAARLAADTPPPS